MLNKIVKHIRQGTLISAMYNKILRRKKKGKLPWQIRRGNSSIKFDLIKPLFKEMHVTSVLDIGCDAGAITRLAGEAGFFSVGIDKVLDFQGVAEPLDKACIGKFELNQKLIKKLPVFDAVLLLSVHHQLIEQYGDEYTQKLVYQLSARVKEVLIMEFAALNEKYSGTEVALFKDNDESSITEYAYSWLHQTLPGWTISYIGKAPESKKEPYRFMFACKCP